MTFNIKRITHRWDREQSLPGAYGTIVMESIHPCIFEALVHSARSLEVPVDYGLDLMKHLNNIFVRTIEIGVTRD